MYIGLQPDKKLYKISDGDKLIKKFALPLIVILIFIAYANNYLNKQVQKNNKYAAGVGMFDIGNFIGSII